METETTASLDKRIGKRIYLLEDSISRKRKLVDMDETAEEDVAEGDADSPYRPNAILLQGPPITQLPTARVFAYATHFDAHPIGMEWVDDQTCVLVFVSRKTALHGWGALCRTPQPTKAVSDDMIGAVSISVEEVDEAFYPAQPFPVALYPIEERINNLLGTLKSSALKETIRMRWARTTDIKEHSARVKSEFYKRHGERAGKEGLPVFPGSRHGESTNGNKRRKRNDDEETRRQLDAELDIFLTEDENASSNPLALPLAGTQNSAIRRAEDRSKIEEQERRMLDHELDSFLANGSVATVANPGPSLLERTTGTGMSDESRLPRDRSRRPKALPRRGRRKGQDNAASTYRTDADGRWLHNAEIPSRRERDYDESGFGMRAWSSEQTRQPKDRKTQEELDRELDQLWK
ncbi:hypothetical protein JB92DRAFT_2935896 [Gautieria morchelliformis]|nr:hypothetical protein JB92DRAFT_2935896 [Gautieria morchelliformis]